MTDHRQINKVYLKLMKSLQDNDGAECGQLPDVFFPLGTNMDMLMTEIRLAKEVCGRCPVKPECAEYAVIGQEPYGVWGGLTPAERNAIRRRKI